MSANTQKPEIGIVGLWHLGCTLSACWANLGHRVRAVDLDAELVKNLSSGQPPVYEPNLSETIQSEMKAGRLSFSTKIEDLRSCKFVFVTYDTPVREDDSPDAAAVEEVIESVGDLLNPGSVIVISSQLQVGSSRRLRERLQKKGKKVEIVYSPENLRLGEAIQCYTKPGHIVIGADQAEAGAAVEALFAPMQAQLLKMDLASAEMTKHGINSFLACSINFANQIANLCEATGADFSKVSSAMKHDPRIGKSAYLAAGIGFSGGTLGRDLQVLESINKDQAKGRSPLFGEIWRYNRSRLRVVRERSEKLLGTLAGKRIALFGMTYKPGTSTLRRSLPLEVAQDLVAAGAKIHAYDPKANFAEVELPTSIQVCKSAYEAAQDVDLVVLMTEWPEFAQLDFAQLKKAMGGVNLFDTKGIFRAKRDEIEKHGIKLHWIGQG